jgi:carbamoylphosphate synthase large subunit
MNNILLLCRGYQHLSIAYDLIDQGYNLDIIIPTSHPEFDLMKPQISKLDNIFFVDTRDQFLKLLSQLLETKQYQYIYTTFPDHHMKLIAEINSKFDLPGIKLKSYEKIKEKIVYYKIWKDLKIDVPKTYQIVKNKKTLNTVSSNIKFPCLVKPSAGMSSMGIKIISSRDSLEDFFKDVDVKVHDYQESHGEKFKNFEYYSTDSDYIIQEYIDGPVISVIGHMLNKSLSLDFFYDIESKSYPYAAETALVYPSKYFSNDLYENIKTKLEKFISLIELDDCPFMLDVILKDGNIYFIDFAARISAGCHLLQYAGENHYASKLVNSILKNKNMLLNTNKCSMKRDLGLKPGFIKSIEIKKDFLADYVKLPINSKVNLPRNDVSISNNGYVYISGSDLNDMNEKYQNLISSIIVNYI